MSVNKGLYEVLNFNVVVDVGLEVLAQLAVAVREPVGLLAHKVDQDHQLLLLLDVIRVNLLLYDKKLFLSDSIDGMSLLVAG